MTYEKRLPARRSTRSALIDYAASGTYFVTFSTWNQICCLSRIVDDRVELMPLGSLVQQSLDELPAWRKGVRLLATVVMPNHVHVVLGLDDDRPATTSVSAVVGSIKAHATALARERGWLVQRPMWQRSFHDRYVRDAEELERILRYVAANPSRWRRDPENPRVLPEERDPDPWTVAVPSDASLARHRSARRWGRRVPSAERRCPAR